MADGMSVDMSGMDTLDGVLGDFGTETEAKVQTVLEHAGDTCANNANPPVLTGALRDSKYIQIGHLMVEVGFDSDHAVYPELGTVHMAPEPYLLPSFELTVPQLLNDLDNVL